MGFVDPQSVNNPTAGAALPAAWGDTVRDDLVFLNDPPACSVYASSAQSVSHNTPTTLTCNSEYFDNDSMHSTVSNTGRITATTAGRYDVSATVEWASEATGSRKLNIRHNGTTSYELFCIGANAASGSATTVTGTIPITMAAGEYVECRVQHVLSVAASLDTTCVRFSATRKTG